MLNKNNQIIKRIFETKIDIFPLDRLLPLETVYKIFVEEYTKTNDKNYFFRNRKFQRLREGYTALSVAISLNQTTNKNHFLLFPSKPDNDVNILYPNDDKFVGYEFDVKEFTNWSDSFTNFVDKTIIPKINIYNLIIATYRDINNTELTYLVNCLKDKKISTKIWLVGSSTQKHTNYKITKIIIVDHKGIAYDKTINLDDWIDKNKQPIIYQDIVRLVY